MVKKVLLLILFLTILPGLRKVGGDYCRKADPIDMVKVTI